jgi:hypothetical protein
MKMWPFTKPEQRIEKLKVKIAALEGLKKGLEPESKKALSIDKKIMRLNHRAMHLERKQKAA